MSVRVWKRVNSSKHAKSWPHWSRITRTWERSLKSGWRRTKWKRKRSEPDPFAGFGVRVFGGHLDSSLDVGFQLSWISARGLRPATRFWQPLWYAVWHLA